MKCYIMVALPKELHSKYEEGEKYDEDFFEAINAEIDKVDSFLSLHLHKMKQHNHEFLTTSFDMDMIDHFHWPLFYGYLRSVICVGIFKEWEQKAIEEYKERNNPNIYQCETLTIDFIENLLNKWTKDEKDGLVEKYPRYQHYCDGRKKFDDGSRWCYCCEYESGDETENQMQ